MEEGVRVRLSWRMFPEDFRAWNAGTEFDFSVLMLSQVFWLLRLEELVKRRWEKGSTLIVGTYTIPTGYAFS